MNRIICSMFCAQRESKNKKHVCSRYRKNYPARTLSPLKGRGQQNTAKNKQSSFVVFFFILTWDRVQHCTKTSSEIASAHAHGDDWHRYAYLDTVDWHTVPFCIWTCRNRHPFIFCYFTTSQLTTNGKSSKTKKKPKHNKKKEQRPETNA